MWEHRSVSHAYYQQTRRMQPAETYVRLMDQVEETVQIAEGATFVITPSSRRSQNLAMGGTPPTDTIKADPRKRYIGPAKAKLLNTNIILGSTWIESERFKYERRIQTVADFFWQKTVINANMWTPKRFFTTQTFIFCSTGDEERMGGSILEGDVVSEDTSSLLGLNEDGFSVGAACLGLGHVVSFQESDPQDRVFYPSLMHRGVSFNNRVGWVRYSPPGFGKDANGFLVTRPYMDPGQPSTGTGTRRHRSISSSTCPTDGCRSVRRASRTSTSQQGRRPCTV